MFNSQKRPLPSLNAPAAGFFPGTGSGRGSASLDTPPCKAPLRIVLSITTEDAKRRVAQLFHEHGVPLLCEFRAKGTAPTEFLDILGLGGTKRVLTAGYAEQSQVSEIMCGMNQALAYGRRGTGIAVSIPLEAAQGALLRLLARKMQDHNEKDKEASMQQAHNEMNENKGGNQTLARYTLLWTSVVSGYSDDVVQAARAVGARGGTVLHGNRSGENTSLELGFQGQQEQDFVMIIVPSEKKTTVMEAIIKACGLNTPAKGVVVALPVEDAVGLA